MLSNANMIKQFNYDRNKQLRTLYDSTNNIWFSGKDIATILDYSDTKRAIQTHVDNEDKINFESLLGRDKLSPLEMLTIKQYLSMKVACIHWS